MSSRARFKAPVDNNPSYDAEVMDDDDERWARNANGDLDWAYTARTLRRSSPDALIDFLVNNAFTVPARDYNPSAPFVHIKFAANQGGDDGGEAAVTTVSLPHGYRLPLMFVTKYMWATALRTLPSEKEWKEARGNIIHLCRLCENLIRRAHAKALQGGMEKGWRCIMFDRLLARFYKHWDKSNPSAIIGFAKTHGLKEYDRDVLKHDWKRWCLRGLNGVKMVENEVIDGITLEQNLSTLKRNPTTGRWQLNGTPLFHITTKSDPDYMTEVSSLSSLSSDEEPQEEEEDTEVEVVGVRLGAIPHAAGVSAQRQEEEEEEEEDDDIVMLGTGETPNPSGSGIKRPHDFSAVDQDELERQQKRTRIEESLASSSLKPHLGVDVADTRATSSEGALPNPSLNPIANTDLSATSIIAHVNPGPTSPFPVLALTDPWIPLPPSTFERFLNIQTLPQFTNTNDIPGGTNVGPTHGHVALKSRSAAEAIVHSPSTSPASVRANATVTAVNTRPAIPARTNVSQSESQPVPAWKVLDSMVPPRGSKAQMIPSASPVRRTTRSTNKLKGKEKEKKAKTTRAKVQKGTDGQKPKEASALNINAETSRDAAKFWPKPLLNSYGKKLSGLHGTALSSSAILANASVGPPAAVPATRRTASERASRRSTIGTGINELPDTDSDAQVDEEDHIASSHSTHNPRERSVKGTDRPDSNVGGSEIPVHLVQAKALELLISLVTDSGAGTSSNSTLAASVNALAANLNPIVKNTNDDTAAIHLPTPSNTVASSSKAAPQLSIVKPAPMTSWQVHQAFQNTTALIPGRLSPLSAAAVSQFSNQCTQECAGFNNEHGRRLPHPHNPMYPPIGHRGVPGKLKAPYDLFPPAYLRYERRLRKLLEERREGAAVGVDGSMGNETGLLDHYQSLFQGLDIDEDQEDESDRVPDVGNDDEVAIVKKVALRLEDFEERFAGVKAELVAIVERLVTLENTDIDRAAREVLEDQARSNANAIQSELGAQASSDGGSKGMSVRTDVPQGKETERGSPGLVDDMYVDDPITEGGAPTTGDTTMDIQMNLSSGEDCSQTTQPGLFSTISVEDASSSSTLLEASKSTSPPPNASSTESIASSNCDGPNINVDMHQGADSHSVSEADGSELTTVNAGREDVSVDEHAPVLTSSISRMVEELVRAKIHAVMEEMAQGNIKETASTANESKAIQNLARPPSPSLTTQPPPLLRSLEINPDLATLIAELRTLKADVKARELRDKEEKLAMRELHSAEVDALRRRLSYLENRDPGPMAMPMPMSHHYYPPPFMGSDHRSASEHHMSAPPGGEYFDAERSRRQGSFPNRGYMRDTHYADGGVTAGDGPSHDRGRQSASSATSTPAPSDKEKSVHQPPSSETPPLPIKSQRKPHIMPFPRARLP